MLEIWPLLPLKRITTKIGSGATPRGGNSSYKSSGITLIRSLNVYDFRFEYDGLAFIDEEQAAGLSNVKVEKNDILLNITGASVARCCIVPHRLLPARVNQHVSIVRINPKQADAYYVLNVINSPRFKTHLLTIAQGGATREALTKEKIENFEIPLPPLPTQRKIAAVLSAYDDLIENNTRRIHILEEMAQAIYREWFMNFRFPGHEAVRMVDSGTELGMVPEGWEVVKFGNVIELLYGKGLKQDERAEGNIPVFGSSGIVGYHNKALVDGPGIIVGRKGNVGSVFWSDVDFFPIDTTYYVRTKLSLHYAFYNLQSQNFINNDAAVPGLSRIQANLLPFLVPPSKLLKRFEEINSLIFFQTRCLEITNKNLRTTRELLLPKLISGELDVSEMEIEKGNPL